MIITIVRHAFAGKQHDEQNDRKRALTKYGKQQASIIGNFISRNERKCFEIYTSRYERAYQTANIIHKLLPESNLIVADWLNIDSKIGLDHIKNIDSGRHIILVSHEPNISEFLSELSGGKANFFKIEKGSITRIEVKIESGDIYSIRQLWAMPISIIKKILR